MLLERRPSILAVDENQGLPDYLEQGLDYVVTTRFGRDGLGFGPLLISEEEVYIAFLTARIGFELVLEAAQEVGGMAAVARILEADNVPVAVQTEDPEFEPEHEVPDYLLSYEQAVDIDSEVDRAVRDFAYRFGVHFALWVLELFEEEELVEELYRPHPGMARTGGSSVSIGVASQNRLEISLNAPANGE